MADKLPNISHAFDILLIYLSDLSVFSPRELVLLAYFISPGETFERPILATRAAGFDGKLESLSSQASKTLAKANKRGLFLAKCAVCGIDSTTVLRSLGAGLRARKNHISMKRNGQVVVTDIGDDHATQHKTIELLQKLDILPPLLGQPSADAGHGGTAGDEGSQAVGDEGAESVPTGPAVMPDAAVKAIVDRFGAADYNQTQALGKVLEELFGQLAGDDHDQAAHERDRSGERGGGEQVLEQDQQTKDGDGH